MTDTAPLYRATEPVYVDDVKYGTGDEFRSFSPPGQAWEPLDSHGVKAKAARAAARKAKAAADAAGPAEDQAN